MTSEFLEWGIQPPRDTIMQPTKVVLVWGLQAGSRTLPRRLRAARIQHRREDFHHQEFPPLHEPAQVMSRTPRML